MRSNDAMRSAAAAGARDPSPAVASPPQTSPSSGSEGGDLARAGLRGAAWQGSAQLAGKLLVLLTTILLARLLLPEQFGLVALALTVVAFAEAVADAGVAQALIYLPRSAAAVRAALVCAIVSGALFCGVLVAGAPLLADLLDQGDAAPLIRLLAVSLVATSVASVPEALLRRDHRFPRLTVATVLRAAVTGITSVALALAGYGAWSIAWGSLAGALVYAATTWAVAGVTPDLRVWLVTRADTRAVLKFGAPVAGSTILAKAIFDVDYLVVGIVLGVQALGFYTLAFRLPEFLIINVFFVISSVTFPLYAKARAEPARLRRGYLTSVRYQSLYGVCAGAGVAVLAPVLVPLLFGDAWLGAVAPLIALSVYAALRSLGAGANDVYKAIGRPGISLYTAALRIVVLVPALLFATRWGIEGVAWAQAITAAAFVILMQGVALRVVGLRWRQLIVAVLPSLAAGTAVAVIGSSLIRVPVAPVLAVAMTVVGCILAVVLLLRLAFPVLTREGLALLRRSRGGAAATGQT